MKLGVLLRGVQLRNSRSSPQRLDEFLEAYAAALKGWVCDQLVGFEPEPTDYQTVRRIHKGQTITKGGALALSLAIQSQLAMMSPVSVLIPFPGIVL